MKKMIVFFACILTSTLLSQEIKNVGIDPGLTFDIKSEIEKINEKLKVDSENAELYHKRAMLFFAMNDYDNSIQDFSILIENNNSINAEHYFMRGLAKQLSGKHYPISFCDDLKTAKLNGYKNDNWEILGTNCGF